MGKIVTMGEMMMRFMPPDYLKFEQAKSFEVYYGGDESIVASSLARFGLPVSYVTKLPQNPFGEMAISSLRMQGVDTSFIARGGKRIGVNFYEKGISVRPSKVIYDREDSAFATAVQEDFDFDAIFSDAKWFHVSGITPALSESTCRLTEKAMKTAKSVGATVSCDLNYRNKLWPVEKARAVMPRLMEYVDVCINPDISLGLSADLFRGEPDVERYQEMFGQLKKQFGFQYIAATLRSSRSASDNGWSALAYDGSRFCQARRYEIHLLDRGGGGASFSGGLIYGLYTGMALEQAVEFAAASSALKQTINGDFNLASLEDVMQLCAGDTTGRVQR
ncbi:MAG: sugar kinase [Clostridia bacterium]|nr:sugar kinase [Clostridia bacterium]